jgi:hypothetical protein
MNCLANVPNWTLYYLQQSSTKTKVVKTLQTNIVLETEEKVDVADHVSKKEVILDSLVE